MWRQKLDRERLIERLSGRMEEATEKVISKRSIPPAAGSRIDLVAVTARVELVPFPNPARMRVSPQP
jgi:hypothetical protein